MDWQDIWKLVHVLTLVYWVGADLTVFYSARIVANPAYSKQTRATVFHLLGWIDMIPRYMLILTFPVGATLAANLGIGPQGGVWLAVVWVLGIVWLVYVTQIYRKEGTDVSRRMAKIDLYLRFLFFALLVISAVWSLAGDGPFKTTWLAVKVLLFAGTVGCGIGIRVTFMPFVSAFATLMREDSSSAEATMKRALSHAVPFVLSIWILVAIVAFIGLSHEILFGS
jgi:hypothetical protein